MTAGQRWSREKPKVEGWYWWRNRDVHTNTLMLQLRRNIPSLQIRCDGMLNGLFADEIHGEWCGPLEPPHE